MKLVEELETDFLNCLSEQLVACISQGATLEQTE